MMKISEITTERLKVIAEGMGYKVAYIKNNGMVFIFNEYGTPVLYSPLINAEQCMEIMEGLLKEYGTIKFEEYKSGDIGMIDNWRDDYALGEGKTINEAVCLAAYEAIKELKQ